MTTEPQFGGDGAPDRPRTGSIASDAEAYGTASYAYGPRKFGQLRELKVPDNFDAPLADAQLAPWEFRAERHERK